MPENTPNQTGENVLDCDLIVFDLDGTLVDSQRDLANSVNATLAYLHRPALADRQIAEFIGDGASALVRRSLEATGPFHAAMLADAMPFFLEYYRAHNLDFTYAYPGVLSELRHIRNAAPLLPMAVLTNKPVRPSRVICDGLGLSDFFFANYGGDTFPTKKPGPEGMLALMEGAAQILGRPARPDRTVLIGDSDVDVATARNSGTQCIGCTYGLATEKLRQAMPDAFVDAPSEWLSALRELLHPAN